MKTYTTQEAAELTGSSVRALRKRIERGQLRAVQHGRYWKIPHAELERAGMIAPEGTPRGQETEGTDGPDVVLAELERVRIERERLTQELARLRPGRTPFVGPPRVRACGGCDARKASALGGQHF